MKRNLLIGIVSVAGLTSGALAQTAQWGVELVLDNDPRLAAMGVNYGSNALLPGPTATAVGITLIARVGITGGATSLGNFGIAAFGGGGNSANPNSRFSHNDAISNVTNTLWTSPAMAMQRGVSDPTGAMRGLISSTAMSGSPDGRAANYRGFLSGNAVNNSPTANATGSTTPTDIPYTTGVNNGNGFITMSGGSAVILAATGQRGALSTSGGPAPTNFGTTGAMSPWYALYHMVFVPRTQGHDVQDAVRDVTVSFEGAFRYATMVNSIGGNYNFATSGLSARQSASVTFTVPTPGAIAVLGLGGLVAGRRRRV